MTITDVENDSQLNAKGVTTRSAWGAETSVFCEERNPRTACERDAKRCRRVTKQMSSINER